MEVIFRLHLSSLRLGACSVALCDRYTQTMSCLLLVLSLCLAKGREEEEEEEDEVNNAPFKRLTLQFLCLPIKRSAFFFMHISFNGERAHTQQTKGREPCGFWRE